MSPRLNMTTNEKDGESMISADGKAVAPAATMAPLQEASENQKKTSKQVVLRPLDNNQDQSLDDNNEKNHKRKRRRRRQRQRDSQDAANPKWWLRTRIHVALLGLTIAAVNCYAQATFCIAIVEMVLPADYVPTSSRVELAEVTNHSRLATNSQPPPVLGTLVSQRDHSCPIEFKYRDYYDSWRFSSVPTTSNNSLADRLEQVAATSSQTIDVSNRFDWDAGQQGLLLGAFAIGTAPLQIAGGRLAEIYGSKWVLLMGCIGTGLTNLTIPYLAHFSFLLLLVNRVFMGIAQAGMEPGLMCLLADWLTPQEAGFFISMLLFAICLGFFLGSLCSSFILAQGYGWPLTYYVSGGLNLAVALIWYVYADSWPRASKYISEEELRFIEHEQQQQSQQDLSLATQSKPENQLANHISSIRGSLDSDQSSRVEVCSLSKATTTTTTVANNDKLNLEDQVEPLPLGPAAPWLNILSSRPVWAFIICKISIRWCADVLSNELPTYLANVLHLSIKINGLLNSVSTALFAISSFLTGWLATSELCLGNGGNGNGKSRTALEVNRSKTRLRKSFQSLASFGSALCLILMTQFDCDLLVSMSMLLVLSCCLVMGTGGELQIPYDMTSRYPGTLHGLACTLSVSGWLAPPLIGLILGDQPSSRARWSIVWYSTAAINLLGGLIFVLFADASPRDFTHGNKSLSNCSSNQADDKDKKPITTGRDPNTGSYVNDGLNNSSCESSPKFSHQNSRDKISGTNATTNSLNSHKPLDATLISFDCGKLYKCRQSESSFIRPQTFQSINCTANRYLDSPLQHDNDLIYPYREQELQQQRQPSGLRHKQQQPIDNCFAACEPTTTTPATVEQSKQRASSDFGTWSQLFQNLAKRRKDHHNHNHQHQNHSEDYSSSSQSSSLSKSEAAAKTISTTTTTLANEKFMPNERSATAAPVIAIIADETINHSSGSHDRRRQPTGSKPHEEGLGGSSSHSRLVVAGATDEEMHTLNSDTPPPIESPPHRASAAPASAAGVAPESLIENAAARPTAPAATGSRQNISADDVKLHDKDHHHHNWPAPPPLPNHTTEMGTAAGLVGAPSPRQNTITHL